MRQIRVTYRPRPPDLISRNCCRKSSHAAKIKVAYYNHLVANRVTALTRAL